MSAPTQPNDLPARFTWMWVLVPLGSIMVILLSQGGGAFTEPSMSRITLPGVMAALLCLVISRMRTWSAALRITLCVLLLVVYMLIAFLPGRQDSTSVFDELRRTSQSR